MRWQHIQYYRLLSCMLSSPNSYRYLSESPVINKNYEHYCNGYRVTS